MKGGSGAPAGAVFLSYASQDAEAAQRICDALRAASVEVWLDKSELRGGDAWDRSIRQQIHDCALFVPIISQHTHERLEGYFRLEWKLAVDRTHTMAEVKAFLVPVVIDGTTEHDPTIPEKFRELQWTRLPGGETPRAFVERVQRLLSGESLTPSRAQGSAAPGFRAPVPVSGSRRVWPVAAVLVVLLAAAGYLAFEKPWLAKPAAFAPPPHSVAVLPFVNMSGDKEQEYFSEGLTEELLNSLSRLNELQVAARTSSFSFQGEHPDIATVARKLNVSAVLEGSVRRSGNTVRITTQLVNGVTGFHLWSQSYDRDLGDVLKLQTEIANAVASALKVTLLGDVTAKVELGGTRNPGAFDVYLRAIKIYNGYQNDKDLQASIAAYTAATQLDPNYALAYAERSIAYSSFSRNMATGAAIRDYENRAQADAQKAIALAPDLAEGHLALGMQLANSLQFARASEEYERARSLAPGNARVLSGYSAFATDMGHADLSLSAARRSVELDPLNAHARDALGRSLLVARRYAEAVVILTAAIALEPNDGFINARLGNTYYLSGDIQRARTVCEGSPVNFSREFCLALVYQKLGRRADAESQVADMHERWGEDGAVWYAMVYATWGDHTRALDNLDVAMHRHIPYLSLVKASPWLDSVRAEPRFQAVMKALKFPD